jgi:hypothetical protein
MYASISVTQQLTTYASLQASHVLVLVIVIPYSNAGKTESQVTRSGNVFVHAHFSSPPHHSPTTAIDRNEEEDCCRE